MGVDVSLNMIQQKAYKLYKKFPKSLRSKEEQVMASLETLSVAGFDVYNIEMSSTEYSSGNSGKRHGLMLAILSWAREKEVKIIGRAHVVKKGEVVLNYTGETTQVDDSERGVLIHTVMFYELKEDKAPVYGNTNLKHMHALMKKEQGQRETWYYPESAYWVTFDNSVPMFLLPYLSARHTDIQTIESEGIEGHLTFSSGWEWGCWLFDWSIARWSWDYGTPSGEMEPVGHLTDATLMAYMEELHRLQDQYFKDQELMRYLTAQSVLDEVPKRFSREFQPRPRWRYPYLFNRANRSELDSFRQEGILPLEAFIKDYGAVLDKMEKQVSADGRYPTFVQEWLDGLRITLLRAKHRVACLKAIHQYRSDALDGEGRCLYYQHLQEAKNIRQAALDIVERRERQYRYDPAWLATKRKGHTAYHFGYLYPVRQLHFWEREEQQILQNKWGFGFMNIWNVWRIMGLRK
jgi:hypothetical protein